MAALSSVKIQATIDAAVSKAQDLGLSVCIAVADSGANIQGFLRMDDALLGSADVCQSKAKTAVLFRCPTDDFGAAIESEKLVGMSLTNGGLAAFGGGLPVFDQGRLIGGIGVSGATAAEDKQIAEYALSSLVE